MKALLVPAVLLASIQVANAACVLKREALRDDPKCIGLVGYSGGERVGFFHWNGANVGVGGKCDPSRPHGSLAGSNKVNVGGQVRTLTDDCRSTR